MRWRRRRSSRARRRRRNFVASWANPRDVRRGVTSRRGRLSDAESLVGGGDLPARFEAAKATLVSATQNLINKFDVVLAATENQEEALLRMAEKMDWHPDLIRESGPENDALAQVRADVGEVLNKHRGSLDVDVASLPRDAQRALWRWTELDAALYLVAESQRRARTVATLAISEAELEARASAEADPGTRWVRATTGVRG